MESGRKPKVQVGLDGVYMRKAGVVGDAGKNRRGVHVESGRKPKAHVGTGELYMRKRGGNRKRR